MEFLAKYLEFNFIGLPTILRVGALILAAFFAGKIVQRLKLPSLIGYMFIGLFLGPSFLNFIGADVILELRFVTEIILGFIALNIGLELNFSYLKQQGIGIVLVIFAESFGAFVIVTGLIYALTKNLPLALIFGAIAPASAPAGTVAVIQEYKARGRLTKALYTVVGFDDALGIMIFGVIVAFVKELLVSKSVTFESLNILEIITGPLKEIGLSFVIGTIAALIFIFLMKKIEFNKKNIHIFLFGFVFTVIGICYLDHISLILTNMVFGMVVTNVESRKFIKSLGKELEHEFPLFFILFFTLAGSNLHISALKSLGILGVVYIVGRTVGLISGSFIGATVGGLEKTIRKYLGLGILSQAGVAIGLSLAVSYRLKGLGPIVDKANHLTSGDIIAATVLTTITASCLFFELLGPITTKIALSKAGELGEELQIHDEFNVTSKGITQKRRIKFIKNFFKQKKKIETENELDTSTWD